MVYVPPIGPDNPMIGTPRPPLLQGPVLTPIGADGQPANTWPKPRATTGRLDTWAAGKSAELQQATRGLSPGDAELYRRLSFIFENDADPQVRTAAGEVRVMLMKAIAAVKATAQDAYTARQEPFVARLDHARKVANDYTGTYFAPSPRQ